LKNFIPAAPCTTQFLLACLLSLLVGIGQAQTTSPCESLTTGFEGPPGNNPLCEQPVQMGFDIKIGKGTPYPNSSNLPMLPVNPRIEVTGNFNVNTHLNWEGVTIRINPGIAINIGTGVLGPASLTLDNCHLYACTGLWNGIFMNNGTAVKTFNGTLIEDAEGAIQAIHTQNATLDIEHTTFNRNKNGIILENTPNATNKPVFINFTHNLFHCTSALNGTNQTSFAGIQLKNADLLFFPSGVNIFRDQQYWINATGISSHIGTQGLYMQRIKKDGIWMEEGFLNLLKSSFIDCNEKGINIGTAKIVDVRSNTYFLVTSSISSNPALYRTGIYINKFSLNSTVRIKEVGFVADMGGTQNLVRGIHLKGGNVGAGTKISISQNPFNIRSLASDCIFLEGDFPATSETHIFGNNRFTPGSVAFDISTGIHIDGNMNNLDISGNHFTGGNGVANIAIKVVGSSGVNNFISDNQIEGGLFFAKGIYVDGFQSTTFCSNTDNFGSNTAFEFWNTNTGTIFTENKLYANGIDIRANSLIGVQPHMGNEWHPFFVGSATFRANKHAICRTPGLAASNKFTVHTNQSIWIDDPNGSYYDFFSPFYPENIDPADPIFDFFGMQNSTPASGCSQLNDPDNGLDKDIADGLLPILVDNPSMAWITKGYLYKKLKGNLSLASSYPSYLTFLSNNSNTNIGKFYEVDKKIAEAFSTTEMINQQSTQMLNDIVLLIDNLAETDSMLESTIEANTLAVLTQEKSGYLEQLISRTTSYNSISATYKTQMLAKMQEALTLSQQIMPTAQLDANQKVVNEIYLHSLVAQGGTLTEAQIASLKDIGQQCPETGGLAVTMALSLLPDCEKISLDICAPALTDDVSPISSYAGQGSRGSVSSKSNTWLYPNPAASSFFVTLTEGNRGTFTIADLSGKTLYNLILDNPGVPTEISQPLSPEVYFGSIRTNSGVVLTEKLIIQPK